MSHPDGAGGMSAGAPHWITECAGCAAMFREDPTTCGICPHCGHDNDNDEPADLTNVCPDCPHPADEHHEIGCADAGCWCGWAIDQDDDDNTPQEAQRGA